MTDGGRTIWERLAASLGLWTVLWLGIAWGIQAMTTADPGQDGDAFVAALESERMLWELVTFFEIVGGFVLLWFLATHSSHLGLAEGEPPRLARVAYGLGIVWGMIWIMSALFNSAAILLATEYGNAEGARMAATLAIETPYILTPSVAFATTLATAYVTLRFGGFPKAYGYLTAGLSGLFLVLAIVDWYGPGTLSLAIMGLAFLWLAGTSAFLVAHYRQPNIPDELR